MDPHKPAKAVKDVVEVAAAKIADVLTPAVPGAPGSAPPSVDEPTTPREPLPPKKEHGAPETRTPTGSPDTANVQQAIKRFGIPYLVAQDNDFANWNAYRNHYWPSLYLIDKEGYLRFNHIGEGDYDKIDTAVQPLLSET